MSISFVLIGGLNWGLIGTIQWNALQAIFGLYVSRILYILIGVSALILFVRRDTYLPFLGETVLPCSAIQERIPDHADTEILLHGLQPGAKILYWASEPATQGLASIQTWKQAYFDFANAGVAVVDGGGHVILRIRTPQPYTVPLWGRIERHVHWRQCEDGGMLGPVNRQPIP